MTVTRERLAEHLREVLREVHWFRDHYQGATGATIRDRDQRIAQAEGILRIYDQERAGS